MVNITRFQAHILVTFRLPFSLFIFRKSEITDANESSKENERERTELHNNANSVHSILVHMTARGKWRHMHVTIKNSAKKMYVNDPGSL